MKKKNLLFLGAPGSGKGTIARLLTDYVQLSTGDMLRSEISNGTALGEKISQLIDKGLFVPDELMFSVIISNIPKETSLIFDGYPRNTTQIEFFEKLVKDKEDIIVIYFNVNLEDLLTRILGRRTCVNCGEIHNETSNKPNNEGNCRACNSVLNQRKDDNKEAFEKRLVIFKNETFPIIDHFSKYKNFYEIDANNSPELVFIEIKKILQNFI